MMPSFHLAPPKLLGRFTMFSSLSVDEAAHINIAMPTYNLIEYGNNHSDTSGSLWQFKRDEVEEDVDLTLMMIISQIIRHHLSINQVLLQTEMV